MKAKITLLVAKSWHNQGNFKKFAFFLLNAWRYDFFAYLCIRFNLELFKIRTINNLKNRYYDKEIQMPCLRLHS